MKQNDIPYINHMNILHSGLELIDVKKLASQCTDKWYNQTLCKVNDSVIRLEGLEGEYHWHQHSHDDEFFFVVEGQLLIELEGDSEVILNPNQGFVVPKTVQHRPVAPERTIVLMVETADIVPTGDEDTFEGKDH